jgi:hypothetical protein
MRLLAAALAAPPLLLVILWSGVRSCVSMRPPPPLSDEARAAAMAPLRAALDGAGAPAPPDHDELRRKLPEEGPVIVTVWSEGRRAARVEGRGKTIADAIADAAPRVAADTASLTPVARAQARLQVDVVVARAPYLHAMPGALGDLARALGIVPGLEGLGVEIRAPGGEREALLAADDLVEQRLHGLKAPVPGVGDWKLGLDFERANLLLAMRAKLPPGQFGTSPRRYFRFRADTFVERPRGEEGPPLPLVRGLPPGPELTSDTLLDAASAGGRYLVARIGADGRYVYEVELSSGQTPDPRAYSLPRHFGTTYYLAELYEMLPEGPEREELRAAMTRAFDHAVALVRKGRCEGTTDEGKPFACVADAGQAQTNMGSAALAVVALAEYRLVTGDGRYDDLHRALVEWILDLQRPDGTFIHRYDVRNKRPIDGPQMLYFDGEAALALARSYKVFQDERMLRGAELALDQLVRWYGQTFIGRFFFGEEHWTCIASEAAWPDLKHDRYREFCSDYAAFLRTQQLEPGEAPGQEDLIGSYSEPVFVPNNTPAGSRTEAMISAYLLGRHHGKPDERIRKQVLLSVGFLLRQQLRPGGLFFTPVDNADGAFTTSSVDRLVRIDYVQHACSAMLRARDLLQ